MTPQITPETIALTFLSNSGKISSQKVRNADIAFVSACVAAVNAADLNEAIYLIYHNLASPPKCNCGAVLRLKSFTAGYRQFCSVACARNDATTNQKREDSSLVRYGTKFPSQSPIVKDKILATNLINWGAAHAMCTAAVQAKRAETNKVRYGGPAPASSASVREKTRATNIERYGGPAPMVSAAVYNRSRASQIDAWFPAKIKSLSEHVTPNFTIEEYASIEEERSWACTKCSTNFLSNLVDGKIPKCPHCYPYIKSKPEQEVADFITSLGLVVTRNDKTVITRKNKWPLEIDILIESHKLAIEFNGLYTHSQCGKEYHLFKTTRAQEQGYKLVHIFEDEWTNKRHIVESRLRSALGLNRTTPARKCKIVQLTPQSMRNFFELYHIQGSCPAHICLGLELNGTIVAAMSFGVPRFNKNYQWELLRYASLGNVVGGASKLFSNFIKNQPGSIISYCDRRYGTGAVYEKLGFEFEYYSAPSFYYTDGRNRFNRMRFQKHRLGNLLPAFDANLTADENMTNAGYYKIWDCGNYVFSFKR